MPNQRASKLPTTSRGRHYLQRTRDRIESTAIIKKLHQHVMGEIDMTPSQIASAKLLLDRTVPPLKPAENAPQVDAVGGLESLPTSQLHALLLELSTLEVDSITDGIATLVRRNQEDEQKTKKLLGQV